MSGISHSDNFSVLILKFNGHQYLGASCFCCSLGRLLCRAQVGKPGPGDLRICSDSAEQVVEWWVGQGLDQHADVVCWWTQLGACARAVRA